MSRFIKFLMLNIFSLVISLYPQSESSIINQLFSSSNDLTQLSTDLISIGVDGVWFASDVTGIVTITGTIRQSPQNFNQWEYSAFACAKDRAILSMNPNCIWLHRLGNEPGPPE